MRWIANHSALCALRCAAAVAFEGLSTTADRTGALAATTASAQLFTSEERRRSVSWPVGGADGLKEERDNCCCPFDGAAADPKAARPGRHVRSTRDGAYRRGFFLCWPLLLLALPSRCCCCWDGLVTLCCRGGAFGEEDDEA